jgi:hypothetical protein
VRPRGRARAILSESKVHGSAHRRQSAGKVRREPGIREATARVRIPVRQSTPIRRARPRQRRSLLGLVSTAELAACPDDVFDHFDEAHPSAAARAVERIDVDDSLIERSSGQARESAEPQLLACGVRRGKRLLLGVRQGRRGRELGLRARRMRNGRGLGAIRGWRGDRRAAGVYAGSRRCDGGCVRIGHGGGCADARLLCGSHRDHAATPLAVWRPDAAKAYQRMARWRHQRRQAREELHGRHESHLVGL